MPRPRNAPDQLANMSIEELISLKERIEQLISDRIEDEKKALTAKLEAIRRFEAKTRPPQTAEPVTRRAYRTPPRAKAAAKYRNPVTGETWAGRGLQPRWMRQAIESGHKQEDFLIGG